jgi:hypothetical protein
MSPGLRLAVTLASVVGGIGLLAFVSGALLGRPDWGTTYGLAVAGCSALALLAMLYGHGTGCPECGAWWSRCQVNSEVAERKMIHRDGATFGRSEIRTEFRCSSCSHTWSVIDAEEYPVEERSNPRRPNVEDGEIGRAETGAQPHPE